MNSSRRRFLLSSATLVGVAGVGLLSRFAGAAEGERTGPAQQVPWSAGL